MQFAIGTSICLVVTIYRWLYLEESEASGELRKELARGAAAQLRRQRQRKGCSALHAGLQQHAVATEAIAQRAQRASKCFRLAEHAHEMC